MSHAGRSHQRRGNRWLTGAPGAVIAVGVAVGAAILARGGVGVRAADHVDSPSAVAEPEADITDLFAWMTPDGARVNLVLDWFPNAPARSKLPANLLFAFHVTSRASLTAAAATDVDIICGFDAAETLSCWVGEDDFVTGPRNTNNVSLSKNVTAFAGTKDDPFFFNLTGFKSAVSAVAAVAPAWPRDGAGCPTLDADASAMVLDQLKTGNGGVPAANDYSGENVQTIALQIDKSLLTRGGPILGVWASTNRRS